MPNEWLTLITVMGTAATLISMAITIWQTIRTTQYSRTIKADVRKINLMKVAEQLRRALDNIRKLPASEDNMPRGKRVWSLVEAVKACFDDVLGLIDPEGPDSDLRDTVSQAQRELTSYQSHVSAGTLQANHSTAVQSLIQDALASSTTRIFKMEGKA
jgi:hypothetical protein